MTDFSEDVRRGLTQVPKTLHCRYFYDDAGSALFEQICDVEEYYIPRAEKQILMTRRHELVTLCPDIAEIVELGGGGGQKTQLILEGFLEKRVVLRYRPIDISQGAIDATTRLLAERLPQVTVTGLTAEYQEGLQRLKEGAAGPCLILWLGSNIGNLNRADAGLFLRQIRDCMGPADRLLVGIDLRKDANVLHAAYNDSQGVTAAFNKNMLKRINRELGGDFDLSQFEHSAIYDSVDGCIKMYLRSTKDQQVIIDGLNLCVVFERGESIHTEDSYKYSMEEIETLVAAAQLREVAQWVDDSGAFVDALLAPK